MTMGEDNIPVVVARAKTSVGLNAGSQTVVKTSDDTFYVGGLSGKYEMFKISF